MDCRILQIFFLLTALAVCGSYAYSRGRHGRGHHHDHYEPDSRFFAHFQPHGYGYGYGHHRGGYIRGGIYDGSDSQENSESEEHGDHDGEYSEHYAVHGTRFHISMDSNAFAYIDEQGELHGFLIDLMRAVCERAHETCYFVADIHKHCWDTHGDQEIPGKGLLDQYYHGCLGFWQSATRRNSFNFSLPFTTTDTSSLYYKAGAGGENPTTVTGHKIGFMAGWPVSANCFQRQSGFDGNSAGKYTVVEFDTVAAMMEALKNDQINAVVTMDIHDNEALGIETAGESFHCTQAGGSVMTMYGSEVLEWWNRAFQEMKADGSFRRLCEQAVRTHGSHGPINCIPY